MARTTTRKSIGLGFLEKEARHGFVAHIPRGGTSDATIVIAEYRGDGLHELINHTGTVPFPSPTDASVRVIIDRLRWDLLAPGFWSEATRRLRDSGLSVQRLPKRPGKPIPIHPSLGKELCILCWAVEDATPDAIPNALLNWGALAPAERWWLYTMTVATTGQALQRNTGWRQALRAALADNPFHKGEGLPPKSRRQLLSHPELDLEF